MEKEPIFTKLEEEITENNLTKDNKETETSKIFISNLPDWDLEPPFETLKRG